MKKSQLRKIIRESIKELYEQGTGCNVPTSLSTSNISYNSAQLSWGIPAGSVNSFEVRITEQGRPWGSYPHSSTYSAQSNNTLMSGLSSSTTYEWQVKSICPIGNSDWSSIEMFDTQYPVGGTAQGFAGCDQSAWSGYSSWANSFNNMPHFNSTNPNQPCNMIC